MHGHGLVAEAVLAIRSVSVGASPQVYYELAWETRIRHARREFNVIGDLVYNDFDINFTSL